MTNADEQSQLVATARTAGIWYLMLAVSGVLGFMIFHSQVYVSDPAKTLANLVELESTARIRLLLEFAIVVSQALTAVWFYKLFRNINNWAAWAVGAWGTVNAVVIMISAIAMGSAIQIATSAFNPHEKVALIELLRSLITHSWGVGELFFGLWLIPLGYIITSSKRMPIWIGRTMILGGIGYILSPLAIYAGIEYSVVSYITIPATIGEFWMIGYMLIFGIRPVK